MKILRSRLVPFGLILAFAALPAGAQPKAEAKKPVVTLETSLGSIQLELDPEKAPVTVANFLAYVDGGFFDGTVFHRVIPDFMIQGGGFAADMTQKPTKPPIKNEADNGLENDSWTVAMARTSVKDSATAQFFINLKDNDFLNHALLTRGYGYAVFGRVISGKDAGMTLPCPRPRRAANRRPQDQRRSRA
jgi:cyclophilin family peptidyl-prolyl cis-trans isomerase